MVTQESPLSDWFREFLVPGYHVAGVRYDLANLITKTEALVQSWQVDRSNIEKIIERGQQFAFATLNAYSQIEAMAWALRDAWRWGGWEVSASSSWRVYHAVNGSRLCENMFLDNGVRAAVAAALPQNFEYGYTVRDDR